MEPPAKRKTDGTTPLSAARLGALVAGRDGLTLQDPQFSLRPHPILLRSALMTPERLAAVGFPCGPNMRIRLLASVPVAVAKALNPMVTLM
jgi:hypothetical protein